MSVIEIKMQDGRIVTGWRAWLIAIPMFPVIAVYILMVVVQVIGNTILGRGKWIRLEDGGWRWEAP